MCVSVRGREAKKVNKYKILNEVARVIQASTSCRLLLADHLLYLLSSGTIALGTPSGAGLGRHLLSYAIKIRLQWFLFFLNEVWPAERLPLCWPGEDCLKSCGVCWLPSSSPTHAVNRGAVQLQELQHWEPPCCACLGSAAVL